jgi:hypothetical protein
MEPKKLIAQFDEYLKKRNLELEAVIVGGAALALLGIISRETRDCDVLHPLLPVEVKEASQDFAQMLNQGGIILATDWLNNGPSSLASDLPKGWMKRIQEAYSGKAITLHSLGRDDLLKSKLFALCDRGTDLADCVALAPTLNEIHDALSWLKERDTNPLWPDHVEATLNDLARRLRHGI